MIFNKELLLATGCSDYHFERFLECEIHILAYEPIPISIIGNVSKIDEFCEGFNTLF